MFIDSGYQALSAPKEHLADDISLRWSSNSNQTFIP